jgi:hypothetical protein
MTLANHSPNAWSITQPAVSAKRARAKGAKRRGPPEQPADALLLAFIPDGADVEYADANETATPARRGARDALDFSVELAGDEHAVLIVRDRTSGALTFHAPVERTRRSGAPLQRGADSARFVVAVRDTPVARRGPITKLLKLVIVKLKDALFDKLLGKLESVAIAKTGEFAERLWWRTRGLSEGLFRVRPSSGKLELTPVAASEVRAGRSLLLIHGTFSHAAAAFGGLVSAPAAFFQRVQALYGDRIYAFNHFTVCRTPEDNARALLASLPDRKTGFDAITHSRGGLVLRYVCERADLLGAQAQRFELGRGVLVASPNCGTPLATQARWEQTLGIVANLLELFPDNPWTMGADFIATGLLWLAKHIGGDLPGLASMDRDGETIAALQAAGGPNAGRYSSLGANFYGNAALWQRLADAGVDAFFAGANDLVVPAEGSWLVDEPGAVIPADRIACFGPGGNLDGTGSAHHLNLFDQPQTVDFLLDALGAGGKPAPPLDPSTTLPVHKLFRGAELGPRRALGATIERRPPPLPAPLPAAATRALGDDYATDTLYLTILGPLDSDTKHGQRHDAHGLMMLAVYGSARVLEPFPTRDPARKSKPARGESTADSSSRLTPGKRFQKIIATHKTIRACLDGKVDRTGKLHELPNEEALRTFGGLLFDALFTEGVRRLYDVARSERRGSVLNIVLTCTVPWLAAIPWEFACDPERKKFLASEEVHFVRNVLTPVPAQVIAKRSDPLRILIVSSQPRASAELSVKDEEERIKLGFHTLTDAKLAEVDVLVDTTAARLHDQIQASDIEGKRYDIVHFIGHAQFDQKAASGALLFVTSDGGPQEIHVRELREILCGRGIHLVFLNACDTAYEGGAHYTGGNRGVAQALVDAGMPGVIANQYKVLDSSAVAFSERFYWSLALGATLGQAAREARVSLNYSLDGEVIDWAVPVLYARDANMALCTRWTTEVPKPVRISDESAKAATQLVAARRSSQPKVAPIRVAIADTTRFFGELPSIVERMNSVQERFVFQVARVVMPLGVWAIKKTESRANAQEARYLVPNRLADKLETRRKALGVDFLSFVTDQRMDTGDLYDWWSGKADRPITIFSTWHLELPARGPTAGRVIANEITTSIAAQMLDAKTHKSCTHEDGQKDCPFFYNDDRDARYIVNKLTFEPRCRAKLRSQLPEETEPESLLTAFEALFNAFET